MQKRNIYTKEQAEEYAKDFQRYAGDVDLSYGELAEWGEIFEELAERFDLTDEFKENGII
jgi:hypothetical protein